MWDERYSAHGYVYGTEPNEFLVSVATRIPPAGRVLCIGEGEGRNAVWLATRGFAVVALDQSAVGLAKAERLAAVHAVSIMTYRTDLADYPWVGAPTGAWEAGPWDAVVAIWCHLPPQLRARTHRLAAETLRAGGAFILEAYTPAQIGFATGGPRDPTLCMTLDQLRTDLVGLDIEVGAEVTREVHEGHLHRGLSAVVQVVARKPA